MATCDCLEKLDNQVPWPFYKPITIDPKTFDIECRGWAVRLFNETPSGRISTKDAGTLRLNFCPFCGQDLREKEDKDVSGGTN